MSAIEDMIDDATNMDLSKLSPDEILAWYDAYKISALKPIEKPIPIVTIQGKEICTPGNITAISGKAKSAKSAIANILLSGAIAIPNTWDGHEEIIIKPNPELKAVIHIDTEQSPWHSYRNFKNALLKRAELDQEPDHYYSYTIHGMNFSEYQPFITNIFRALNEKHGGIFLVVIDGGADFVSDTNDKCESEAKVSFFRRLSVNYHTAIIMICHLNPGEGKTKMQGHFGTTLERKAESILRITKKGDISYLEPDEFRSAGKSDFTPMPFRYDQAKEYHVFIDQDSGMTASGPESLEKTASFIFTEERKSGEAVALIMQVMNVKKRKGTDILKEMEAAEIITARDAGRFVFYSLKIADDTPF